MCVKGNACLYTFSVDGQMYWANGNNQTHKPNSHRMHHYRSSADVEMTAYALLAILHQTSTDEGAVTNEIMDIVRWLSRQRNSRGGFSSTQVRVFMKSKGESLEILLPEILKHLKWN